MASKSHLRVSVKTGNQTSRLFSLSERENGDLVINIKSANLIRDPGTKANLSAPKIINQKYSIHCSNRSEENINAIVHRIELDNGEEITTSNYTKALKQTNWYAAIYSARSPNLSIERYKIDPCERETIVLSEYDSSKLSFYYMVCVCNYDAEKFRLQKDIAYKYIDFTHFRVLVLWCFQMMPSHSSGSKSHFMTMDPKDFPEEYRAQLTDGEGFSQIELPQFFRQLREAYKQEYRTTLEKELQLNKEVFDFMFSLPFSSQPIY